MLLEPGQVARKLNESTKFIDGAAIVLRPRLSGFVLKMVFAKRSSAIPKVVVS